MPYCCSRGEARDLGEDTTIQFGDDWSGFGLWCIWKRGESIVDLSQSGCLVALKEKYRSPVPGPDCPEPGRGWHAGYHEISVAWYGGTCDR